MTTLLLAAALLGAPIGEARVLDAEELRIREALRASDPEASEAFARATDAYDAGRLAEARQDFQEVLERAPRFGPAHRRLALALLAAGEKPAALEHAKRALELDPSPHSHLALATVLMKEPDSDPQKAEAELDAALRLDPEHSNASFGKALLAARRRDRAAVERSLQVLRSRAPDSAATHMVAALAAALNDDPLGAVEEAAAAEVRGAAGYRAQMEKAVGTRAMTWARLEKYGPRALAAWAAGLAALFLLGLALSRIQFAVTGRKAASGEVAVSGAERLVLLVYQAVILAQPSPKLDLANLETAADEAMQRAPSTYDSHPPPLQRIAWAERYDGAEPDRYPAPAGALLEGRDRLDEQMSEELEGRMRAYLATVQPAPAS